MSHNRYTLANGSQLQSVQWHLSEHTHKHTLLLPTTHKSTTISTHTQTTENAAGVSTDWPHMYYKYAHPRQQFHFFIFKHAEHHLQAHICNTHISEHTLFHQRCSSFQACCLCLWGESYLTYCKPREKLLELLKAEGERWRVNRELVWNEKEVDRQTEAETDRNGEREKVWRLGRSRK